MNTQINFPLFLPGRKSDKNNKISILAADIGGTKTNVGWFESEDGMLVLKEEATYSSKTHQSFSHIIQKFIREYTMCILFFLCKLLFLGLLVLVSIHSE